MFKIGDFSKLSQVSMKALRFYDQIGLLKPAHVDNLTGYRYYSADQLPRLNRILAFKELGFTLEEIGPLLEEGLPTAQIRGMLRFKHAEIQRRMREEEMLLARVEARLKQIEQEGTLSDYEVVIKKVEPLKVAFVRDIIPYYYAIGSLLSEVGAYIAQVDLKPAGPSTAIWHENEYKECDVDATGYTPVEGDAPGNDRVKIMTLPAETMASVIHHGSYADLPRAYAALLTWIETNGHSVVGYNREIYLKGLGKQNDPSCVSEIQFPVAR